MTTPGTFAGITAEIIEVLQQSGWGQWQLEDPDTGAHCLVGAAGIVWHFDPFHFDGDLDGTPNGPLPDGEADYFGDLAVFLAERYPMTYQVNTKDKPVALATALSCGLVEPIAAVAYWNDRQEDEGTVIEALTAFAHEDVA